MWSIGVVVEPPALEQHPCFEHAVEELAVEVLVSEPSVERLDEAVLPRAPRVDEDRAGAVEAAPVRDRVGDELRSAVEADVARRDTSLVCEAVEDTDHVVGVDGPLHLDRQCLPRELVDDVEQLERPCVLGDEEGGSANLTVPNACRWESPLAHRPYCNLRTPRGADRRLHRRTRRARCCDPSPHRKSGTSPGLQRLRRARRREGPDDRRAGRPAVLRSCRAAVLAQAALVLPGRGLPERLVDRGRAVDRGTSPGGHGPGGTLGKRVKRTAFGFTSFRNYRVRSLL